MDIPSILRATFAVPLIEPEWQSRLLLQLGSTGPADVLAPSGERPAAGEVSQQPFVDMGQGSREQQYSRQKPVLRIVTSTRPG